jgi:anti-anti-sigma factor
MATTPRLRNELERALAGGDGITIDLRACTFIDSNGIAALVGAAWRLKERGLTMHIRGVRDRVRRAFDLAGLSRHEAIVLEESETTRR